MAVLGTIILVFIITHMVNFWAVMHFDKNMPLQTITVTQMGMKSEYYITTDTGKFFPANPMQLQQMGIELRNRTEFYNKMAGVKMGEGYKDLYKITVAFFKNPKFGLIATLLYVLSMFVLAFHLLHGFSSAFQSIGFNNRFTPTIKKLGAGFAIVVPMLFAIIPVYIHFFLK
jgi:succinate dehydrogenase / fumarate reductase cytochrome b subunit